MKKVVVVSLVAAGVCAGGCLLGLGKKTVRVSDFGFDALDSTAIVQKALDAGADCVVFDAGKGAWVTGPIYVRSNTEVIFEEGAKLLGKEGEFLPLRSSLLNLICVTNVVMRGEGKGALIKMRRLDYEKPPYKHGEWRHTINLMSTKNVTIANMTMVDSGGDGIYVGAQYPDRPNENLVIKNCVCDGNSRQGISVISARNMLIEDTILENTCGTPPMAGIDFEPNNREEELTHCVMRNCISRNNKGAGFDMYLAQLDERTHPVTITLENCRAENNKRAAIPLMLSPVTKKRKIPSLPQGGFLHVKGCTFISTNTTALSFTDKPAGVMDVTIEDTVIDQGTFAGTSIEIITRRHDGFGLPSDGFTFKNVTCRRLDEKKLIHVSQMPWKTKDVENIVGFLTLITPAGEKKITLDKAWCGKVSPKGDKSFNLKSVAFDPALAFPHDSKPGEHVKLSPLKLRFGCEAIVYAAKPGPISFDVRYFNLGKNRDAKDPRFFVSEWKTGKRVATLPAVNTKTETRTFTAPKAGYYRLSCKAGRGALIFTAATAPMGFTNVPVMDSKLDIFVSEGSFWFRHAPTADEVLFTCGGGGEYVTMKLFDPAGKFVEAWEDQGDWAVKRIAPEMPAGIWRVDIKRPCKGLAWEDSYLERTGAPSYFFLTPEKTF